MADIAYCNNIKCVLCQRRTRYPDDQVPKCRLCGGTQFVEKRVLDPVINRPALPTWETTTEGGSKPDVLQVAMYAPCTNPDKQWSTVSAVAEIVKLYRGVKDDDRDTVALRIRLLRDKILEAEKKLPLAGERSVQKLFIVPEWFFRKCIDQDYYGGQYSEEEMRAAVQGLLTLSAQVDMREWLIVAGSIRWRRPVTTATRRHANGDSVVLAPFECRNTWLELNTTVVVFKGKMIRCYYKKWNGGDTGGEVVQPDKLGDPDVKRIFATQHSVRNPTVEIRTALNELVKVKWHFGVDIDDAVVPGNFTFRTVKMGVEICADADNAALRTDVDQSLDLHIIVSCDLEDLDPFRCAAIKNAGYLVQCDGNQLSFKVHKQLSFKVLRRTGLSYETVRGELHGETVSASIYVTELTLD